MFFQLSIEKAQAIAEQVDLKAKVVQSEVKTITLRHKKALEERECELLWKVNERTNINSWSNNYLLKVCLHILV